MESYEIRRRLRAARALAAPTKDEMERRSPDPSRGITVPELAERLQDEWPTSAKTIGAIERGEREIRPMELRTIAAACGLPYEFFTAELSTFGSGQLDDRLARLEDLVRQLAPLSEQEPDEARTLDRRPRRSAQRNGATGRADRKSGRA